jgi:hypothetical protein
MKIHAIKDSISSPTQLDLDHFSKDLRALSDRYGIKLVSLGAMSGLDAGAKGTTYLAIWSTEPNENQGNWKSDLESLVRPKN